MSTTPNRNLLPQTTALLQQGIANGLHLGSQLYVSRHGEIIADIALGQSRPGVAMTTDTINLWFSSGKPFAAVAIAQLWERGLLDLDDRVVKFLPEFGVKGKEPITIRHLLTHTGGFRAAIGLNWTDSFEDAVAKVCKAPLEPRWIPGRTAGYHAFTAWYILGEIVRRIDGRPFNQYARETIFLPLGMNDTWIGIPPDQYRDYGERIGFMYDTSKSREPKSVEFGNTEQDAAANRPSSNARGPIRELGRFYEALNDRDNPVLLRCQTIEAMTARHRTGINDLTFKHVVDFGLGFIINSNHYGAETVPYGYGDSASPRTFGHSGQESSCAFCDPEIGLVVAWICNGMPGDPRYNQRQRQINNAIYADIVSS